VLTHSIINLLGIKDKHVEIFDSGEEEDVFWFELHTRVNMQKCPKCKSRTKRIHSYRMQKIQSSSMAGKRVYLHVKKRRYRCTTCGHTFYEKLSFEIDINVTRSCWFRRHYV
jgi:transposase